MSRGPAGVLLPRAEVSLIDNTITDLSVYQFYISERLREKYIIRHKNTVPIVMFANELLLNYWEPGYKSLCRSIELRKPGD